jgi:hypothetical protein
VKSRATIVLSAVCAALVYAPAQAAPALEIPIATLVAQRHDLVGFGPARTVPYSTTYALEWALSYEQGEHAAESEANELGERGFQEGVAMFITGREEGAHEHKEAVSKAIVFATPTGAQEELAAAVSTERKDVGKAGAYRSVVSEIPGSIGIGFANRHGAADNVTFSTGRCYFTIGDAVHRGSRARRDAERPVRSAAIAVYTRAKQACAPT